MHNDNELSLNELDQVAGGDLAGIIVGWAVGKFCDFIGHAESHVATNVVNAVLNSIGQPPIPL
jgi:hypothetical protein